MVYDINLMPSVKRNATSRIGLHMTLLGISVAAVLVVCFYIYPLQLKTRLQSKLEEQELLLETYTTVEEDYVNISTEVSRLDEAVSLLKTLRENKKDVTPLLDQIEDSMPRQMSLRSITADSGLVTINGTSGSYKEVSQFIVNLRKTKDIKSVTFTSALVNQTTSAPGLQEEAKYDFTIYIKHDFIDVIAEVQASEEAQSTEATTNGEAVKNEVNE